MSLLNIVRKAIFPETMKGREARLLLPLYEHLDAYVKGYTAKEKDVDEDWVIGSSIISTAKGSFYTGLAAYGIASQIAPGNEGSIAATSAVTYFFFGIPINIFLHLAGQRQVVKIDIPKKSKKVLEESLDEDYVPYKNVPLIKYMFDN